MPCLQISEIFKNMKIETIRIQQENDPDDEQSPIKSNILLCEDLRGYREIHPNCEKHSKNS